MKLSYKIFIPTFFILLGVTFGIIFITQRALRKSIIREEFFKDQETITKNLLGLLNKETFANPFIALSQKQFLTLFERIRTSATIRFTVWDKNHKIIFSDLTSIIGLYSPNNKDLARLFSEGRAFSVEKQKDDNIPIQSLSGEFIDTYMPIRFSGELVGAIEIQSAVAAVLAPLEKITTYTVLIFLIANVLLYIVMMIIYRYFIFKPLNSLRAISEKINAGNYNYQIMPRSNDEFGNLLRDFDTTSRKIGSLIRNIEQEKIKFQTTLQSIGDGVFVIDHEGLIIFLNHVAADLANLNINEVIGKPYRKVLKFISRKDRSETYQFIEEALGTGKISHAATDTLLVTKKGEVPIRNSAAPIKDFTGNTTGCIVVFCDVTREYEIDKAKTEFLSLASHQLRTPLTAILWTTEILLEGEGGEKKAKEKEMLHDIYASTVRMADLVNIMLNIARIEAGRLSVTPERTDLVKLSENVLSELTPLIKNKKHQFSIVKPQSVPWIITDPKLVREILANLLSNAIKYTPPGGRIELGISPSKRDRYVLFYVKDNGLGISKNNQKKVFQKFFRGDNVVKVDTDGTGLGLYIVYKLSELLKSKIWFESAENKGTTFFFTLPFESKALKGDRVLA